MQQKFGVCLVGLCFLVSVTFLLFKDPKRSKRPALSSSDTILQEPSPGLGENFTVHRVSKDRKKENCLNKKFKDILLVIIYNHPLYDSANLLREFYQPVFPNIYFCGEQTNASYGIHYAYINKGIYGYQCLADAIERNRDFAGYLYINDDVIVNYWNLVKFGFDFSHIGESSHQFGKIDINQSMPTNWYWWISPYGFKNCKKSIEEITKMANHSPFYKNAFDTYHDNGRGIHYCHNGRSDIVFIPRKASRAFYEISRIFYKHHVFLEIAIPTILRFLVNEDQISTLHGLYLPGDVRKKDPRVTDSRYFWTAYLKKASLWFIHPFKLHHYENHNRDLNIELMRQILIAKSKQLTKC